MVQGSPGSLGISSLEEEVWQGTEAWLARVEGWPPDGEEGRPEEEEKVWLTDDVWTLEGEEGRPEEEVWLTDDVWTLDGEEGRPEEEVWLITDSGPHLSTSCENRCRSERRIGRMTGHTCDL